MVLRHLKYFAMVAQQGSVSRAAAKLRVAQPALSRQIHALERIVGATLFERERRGVRLTPAGAALLQGAHTLLARLEQAVRRTRLAHEGKRGVRRLGLGRIALGNARVGRAVAQVSERLPDIELAVREVPSFSQAQALRAREIEIAVGVQGAHEENSIRHVTLFTDSVDRTLLPANHPLATAKVIEPQQLAGERLMMLRADSVPGYAELFDALKRLGFSAWDEYESMDTVYGLVSAGVGWTTHLERDRRPSRKHRCDCDATRQREATRRCATRGRGGRTRASSGDEAAGL